jgi:hypothetical protein
MKKLAVFFLGFLMAHAVCAAELFGTVDAVFGEATVTDVTGASKHITSGLKIFSGQSVKTSADGEVHIVTEDSGLIALRPNSSFRVDRYQAKGKPSDEIVFSLFKGALRSITGWITKRNSTACAEPTMRPRSSKRQLGTINPEPSIRYMKAPR